MGSPPGERTRHQQLGFSFLLPPPCQGTCLKAEILVMRHVDPKEFKVRTTYPVGSAMLCPHPSRSGLREGGSARLPRSAFPAAPAPCPQPYPQQKISLWHPEVCSE